MGHFVSPPREREKKDSRRGDERGTGKKEKQERKCRNRNIPPLPFPVTGIAGLAQMEANISWTSRRPSPHPTTPRWRPSWISDRNNFSYFWSTSHLDASYQVSSQLAFWIRRSGNKKKKKDFPDLGFPIGTILAIFGLQVIPLLPTKFQANWPFGSEEAKK